MMLQKIIPQPAARQAFDLFGFLTGRTIARGIFEDRFGKLRRSFTVEIVGTMNNGVLVLEEDFVYSDGSIDRRIWRLERSGEGRFRGICEDALTVAQGRIEPDRCEMSYKIMLAIGAWKVAVKFDDAFYPIDGHTMVNRATVTKFGLRLGQAIIVFSKRA